GGGWLNLPRLIAAWRERMTEQGRLKIASWNHADLDSTLQGGWDAVIDCRGTAAADDPNGRIDIRANRGEILTVQHTADTDHLPLPSDHILNFGKWTLPVAPYQWRLGASYEWNRKDLNPTGETANFLIDALRTAAPASGSVDILRHDVGLRPVSRDRRPAVGPWPQKRGLFVFNGLGTRGVLIGPRWAESLCDIVKGESQPLDIVDPARLISRL
ncbi:MAG: NAD(P)/FAD-dependent oxidoreductase, partial [Flavobacteriales bacterium]